MPSEGGASGLAEVDRPRLRAASRPVERHTKVIASEMPSPVSLSTLHALRSGADAFTLPDIEGSGWNGGHGRGLVRGLGDSGWGTGSGTGFIGHGCCPARRALPSTPEPALLANAVIVLDLSGSVRESHALIERELRESLSRLEPGTPFNVICFAGRVASFASSSVPATPQNIGSAIAFVTALRRNPGPVSGTGMPDGSTGTSRLDEGLIASFQSNARQVILISDGSAIVREGNRSLTQREILARIRKAMPRDRPAPVVHTVSTNPAGSSLLRRLAGEFEGEYRK